MCILRQWQLTTRTWQEARCRALTEDHLSGGSSTPRRRGRLHPFGRALFYFAAAAVLNSEAEAGDRLRIVAQTTGTFAWELAIATKRGLDKEAGLDIEVTAVASPEAAKIALLGGSADIILSDWLWVARQRGLGGHLVFFPYSTALGALMVRAEAPIQTLADLKGKKLAVAGGPLDKSWLLLRAFAKRSGLNLEKEASIVFGAPPLLYQKTLRGEADATLNYWNFCVALEARGYRRLLSMDEAERRLGAKGGVAMVGYVFSEEFAKSHAPALRRFFAAEASAREFLIHSEPEWDKIGQRIGIKDQAELALYRQTYIDGIPRRSVEEEAADAKALYRILAKTGGPDLVGNATELDEATFYRPAEGAAEEP
jgi:NitT/TauT family transport system substrate-binding protein